MKLKIALVVLVLAALYGGVFFLTNDKKDNSEISSNKIETKEIKKNIKTAKPVILTKKQLKEALKDSDRFVETAVKTLKEKFGNSLTDVKEHLKLMRLRDFIKKNYPDNWKELFSEIIKKAFPDDAGSILSLIDKMDQYNSYLAHENFRGMGFDEMKKTLSSIRTGFFGNLSEIIWGEESKVDHIRDTLAILNKSTESLDDKLKIFRNTLDREFEGEDKLLVDRKYSLAVAFFSMGSVQSELGSLEEKERYKKLSEIRKEIGYTEKEIELLEKRDKRRDLRWKNGLEYMNERKVLKKSFKGEELEREIEKLRDKYFGYESETIATEEKNGFFRYNRKRIYGRN